MPLALRNITSNIEHHRELAQGGGLQQIPCLLIEKMKVKSSGFMNPLTSFITYNQ